MKRMHPQSVLMITLDSCRYDTFEAANAPYLKEVGPLHCAMAPANFTFASHSAMFVGFTPGVPALQKPYVNPKYARIFRMDSGFPGLAEPYFLLKGRNIIEGLRNKGYATFGSGAVDWFDPNSPTGVVLTESFDEFFYPKTTSGLEEQLAWAYGRIDGLDRPVFLFLNIGETHVPYYHKGAKWNRDYNPCVPFGAANNNAEECRMRQLACVEYIDAELAPLLDMFADGTTVVCGDHGDCWGEDGLWEHGITHPKVMEVPLLMRLGEPC